MTFMIPLNYSRLLTGPLGTFLYENLIPNRKLADTLCSLEDREREDFLSFVTLMLAWLPEDRKTARELAGHPFLQLK